MDIHRSVQASASSVAALAQREPPASAWLPSEQEAAAHGSLHVSAASQGRQADQLERDFLAALCESADDAARV